jgi:hypothetical protein
MVKIRINIIKYFKLWIYPVRDDTNNRGVNSVRAAINY